MSAVNVTLWGAGGAGLALTSEYGVSGVLYSGGSGGYTSCSLSVTEGQQLYVLVGGGGLASTESLNLASQGMSAFGGGGMGVTGGTWSSAGGGGRSAIQLSIGVDAVTAGGGGGGGGYQVGYASGSVAGGCGGGASGCLAGTGDAPGGGGNQTSGGRGGAGTYCIGAAGSQYQGGSGCNLGVNSWGSGGGGGYYGGGAGGSSSWTVGGGGGGSGYVGGCAGMAVTVSGSSGSTSGSVLPPQTRLGSYVNGVGEGSAGSYSDLSLNGGNGYVVVTVTECTSEYWYNSSAGTCELIPALPNPFCTDVLSRDGKAAMRTMFAPFRVNHKYRGPIAQLRRSSDGEIADVFDYVDELRVGNTSGMSPSSATHNAPLYKL